MRPYLDPLFRQAGISLDGRGIAIFVVRRSGMICHRLLRRRAVAEPSSTQRSYPTSAASGMRKLKIFAAA
jgi:hypothetical protein